MNALQILKAARAAIQAFEPEQASELLKAFERAHDPEKADPAQARLIATELRAIRDLAAAARDGVASAQEQLKQLMVLAQSLDTYDKAGNRLVQSTAFQPVRKF